MFVRVFYFCKANFKLVMTLLIILLVGMIYYTIHHIEFEHDITKLIPSDTSRTSKRLETIGHMGILEQLLFDISSSEQDLTTHQLIHVTELFVKELEKTRFFKQIYYKIDPEQFQKTLLKLFDKRYALIQARDLSMELLQDKDYIHKQLAKVKFKLLSYEGIISKERLISDPLNLSEKVIESVIEQNITYSIKIKNNVLFSKDGKHVLVITKPKSKSFDMDETDKLLAAIDKIIAKVSQTQDYSFTIKIFGTHVYAQRTASLIRKDITYIFIISILGIILIYYLSFRQFKTLLISLFSIIWGVSAGLFALNLLFDKIHGITLIFGSTLIGVCIDYTTHYFVSLIHKSKQNTPDARFQAISDIRKSLLFGYLTTIIVFIVFSFSGLRFLKEIAIFSCVGITASYFISVFIIPQFTFLKKVRTGLLLKLFQRLLKGSHHFSSRYKKGLLGITAILFIFSAVYSFYIPFDNNIYNLNYVDPKLKSLEKEFLSRYGDITTSNMILMTGESTEEVLRLNDKVYQLLVKAKKDHIIDSYYNIHPFLPSKETQQQNIQNILSIDWQKTREIIKKEAVRLGFKESAFDPFFQGLESLKNESNLITDKFIRTTPFAPVLEELLRQRNSQRILASYFKTRNEEKLPILLKKLEKLGSNIYYINKVDLINKIIYSLKDEILEFIIISFIAIGILLFFLYRNILKVLLALIPAIFGILVSMVISDLLGMKVNIISLFAFILMIGIGLDYGIFITNSLIKNNTIEISGSAIMIAALTTIFAFGILIISSNIALISIGMTILSGIMLTVVFSIYIIPLFAYLFIRD